MYRAFFGKKVEAYRLPALERRESVPLILSDDKTSGKLFNGFARFFLFGKVVNSLLAAAAKRYVFCVQVIRHPFVIRVCVSHNLSFTY